MDNNQEDVFGNQIINQDLTEIQKTDDHFQPPLFNSDISSSQDLVNESPSSSGNKVYVLDTVVLSVDRICYSQYKSKVPVSCSIGLTNQSDEKINGCISISSKPIPFIKPVVLSVPDFKADKFFTFPLELDPVELSVVSEIIEGALIIEFEDNKNCIRNVQTKEIEVMPYNYWSGNPRELCVFVTPNAEEISRLAYRVSEKMRERGESPELDGYTKESAKRVDTFCASVYDTLLDLKINYSLPPVNFTEDGQNIRLVDSIVDSHLATCLDSTLLFASVLEAMSLNPFLVIIPGHAFVGCWLTDFSLDSTVSFDSSVLLNSIVNGKRQVCLIETTCICGHRSFHEAISSAEATAESNKGKMIIVDVRSCRNLKITPIQMTRFSENGKVELLDDVDHLSELNLDTYDYTPEEDIKIVQGKEKDKIVYWSKKLLDLSTRNVLVNLNPKRKKLITLLNTDLNILEDKLSNNIEFSFKESPLDSPIDDFMVTPLKDEGVKTIIDNCFANNTLLVNMDESEMLRRLKTIMYQANSDQNEMGANTLFLGIGILNWYENKTRRFAPIILMPVEIIRISSKNYKLRKRNEDSILNYSIIEKLKHDFQIRIPFDNQDLPTDESGIDIDSIFHTISKCIEKMTNWSLIRYSVLGIFSFSQFIIYNDLISRRNELENDPVTSSLIHNQLEFEYSPIPEIKDDDILNMVLPVSCDESQLRAVKAAKEGCSFVLQGPPGTGKSQTITSIIADCLASDKKVLFVAEKRAALEVVQRNLNKIGLSDFILELHSTKATKDHVIAQFEEALNNPKKISNNQYSNLVNSLLIKRQKLNEIVDEVNKQRVSGLSLYDIICRKMEIEQEFDSSLTFDSDFDCLLSEEDKKNLIDELMLYSKTISDYAPLSKSEEYKVYSVLGDLESLYAEKKSIVSYFDKNKDKEYQKKQFVEKYSFLESIGIVSDNELKEKLDALFEIVNSLKTLNIPDFAVNRNRDVLLLRLVQYREALNKVKKARELIPIAFDDEIFSRDIVNDFVCESRELLKANIIKKAFIQKRIINSLQNYSSQKIDSKKIPEVINNLVLTMKAIQDERKLRETIPDEVLCLLETAGTSQFSLDDFIGKLESYDKQIASLKELFPEVNLILWPQIINSQAITKDLSSIISSLETCCSYSDRKWYGRSENDLSEICEYANNLSDREYARFCELMCDRKDVLEKTKALDLVTEIEENKLSTKEITKAFDLAYYRTLSEKIIDESPILRRFDSEINQINIEDYNKAECEYSIIAKQELLRHLEKNKPDMNANIKQIAEIKRVISKKGRGLSIRDFFTRIPDFYARLFPCFLMSPLSVSQYLDPCLSSFDLVIFDEASQLPTSKAIGAISRAKQLIVVGDSKQLPPTSFFQKKEDEDTCSSLDFEADLESILDDVVAINMPELLLNWHYRSKHESLIQFCNDRYYQNRLKTYPSTDAYCNHVSFHKVKGFYYPKSSEPNPEEVKAVTADVYKRLLDNELCKKSIGIITFNERQQNAIRERLDSLFEAFPELAEKAHWFDDSDRYSDTKLFVKNIENVQGDERDVILFSTCFGPTEDNPDKIDLRFGPIQQAGGERRLNVAFSRAKEEMVIYSIMNPNDLGKKELKSKGLQDLSAFLKYAATESVQDVLVANKTDGIKCLIGDFLKSNNYNVAYDIGDSSFKIDIGVYAEEGHEFKVAILLDGPISYSAKTSRDREVLRPLFLKLRGWRIVRANIIDWNRDPIKSGNNLLKEIERIWNCPVWDFQEPQEKTSVENSITAGDQKLLACNKIIDVPESTYYVEEEYIEPKLSDRLINNDIYQSLGDITEMLFELVNTYGPISENKANRIVAREFSVSRIGNNIKLVFDSAYAKLEKRGIWKSAQIYKAGQNADLTTEYFYWPSSIESMNGYRSFRKSSISNRSVDEIPFMEICNYLAYKLERCFVLEVDDIYQNVAEEFGFKSRTEKFKTVVMAATKYGIASARFKGRDNGKIEVLFQE